MMSLGRCAVSVSVVCVSTMASKALRLIDIGANLTDPMFRGRYHGKQHHPSDYDDILQRSFDSGVEKIIVTGGSLEDCKEALELTSSNDRLFFTVGCHPTRCGNFEKTPDTTPDQYLHQLLSMVEEHKGKVAAIGECGLDYDRLRFCSKPLQLKYFEKQFELTEKTGLPLFLHCRNSYGDFLEIMRRNRSRYSNGVVHSFTGTLPEALEVLDLGLYIGINGCSLKTPENLEVVKALPADRLLLETDAPWCEIRPTHASSKHVTTQFQTKKKERWERGTSVKSRNEPRNIVQVLEVVAALHGRDKHDLSDQIHKNTCTLFNWPP